MKVASVMRVENIRRRRALVEDERVDGGETMPILKNPFARHRKIGSDRMPTKQERPGTGPGQGPSSPQGTDTPSDSANSQARSQQNRSNLVTPPAAIPIGRAGLKPDQDHH
jgi:hypothetical protein